MAGRGPQTFRKKQKEQQRKEKQMEKLERRLQKIKSPDSQPEIETETMAQVIARMEQNPE